MERYLEVTYVELAVRLHLLLLLGGGSESPSAGVEIPLHDAALDLGDNSVVAGGQLYGGHLRDTEGNGFSLGGHQDNLLVDLDALLVTEETGNHELSTVADSIDGTVLDHDTFIGGEERLEGPDNTAEVGLITGVVHHPLRVQQIVKSDDTVILTHSSGPHSSQLLHVSTDSQQQTQVHAEGTDVSTSLTADPEDTEMAVVVELQQLNLVDGSDTELTLDSGDQRGSLEQRSGEGLERAQNLLFRLNLVVETDDTHVLLSGTLLGLYQPSRTVDTDDQTSGDLGVEGSTVSSLLTPAKSQCAFSHA